jgi:hypothetical protein
MSVVLVLQEKNGLRKLSVPVYVMKNLLRDRLSASELDRINRLAEPYANDGPTAGSVWVDMNAKTAKCFTRLDVDELEPTWNVTVENVTLKNY